MLYRGVVEDNNSPTKDGRVKVRVFGIHTDDIVTDNLPWAEVMQGIDFIGSGLGKNTMIEIGTWVFCMLDHDNKEMPIVIGSISAHNDINTKSNPLNQVTETVSGHLIEIDDNSGNERIHIKHKSGTYILVKPDGSIETTGVAKNDETYSSDSTETSSTKTFKSGSQFKVTAGTIKLN